MVCEQVQSCLESLQSAELANFDKSPNKKKKKKNPCIPWLSSGRQKQQSSSIIHKKLWCSCLPWFWERPRFWLSSRSWLTWMSLPGGVPSSPWCRVCWGRWRVSSVGTWGTRTSSCSHGYRGWQGRQLSGWRSCNKGVVTKEWYFCTFCLKLATTIVLDQVLVQVLETLTE